MNDQFPVDVFQTQRFIVLSGAKGRGFESRLAQREQINSIGLLSLLIGRDSNVKERRERLATVSAQEAQIATEPGARQAAGSGAAERNPALLNFYSRAWKDLYRSRLFVFSLWFLSHCDKNVTRIYTSGR